MLVYFFGQLNTLPILHPAVASPFFYMYGRTSLNPDKLGRRAILIIGFFFENWLLWQFEVGKNFLQMAVLGYVFIYIQIKY
jgi:hypothetical protein